MQCYYGIFLADIADIAAAAAAVFIIHMYTCETVCMQCTRCAQFVGHTVCFTMSHDNRTWTTCTTIERLIFSVGLSLIWCFDIMMNPIGNNNSECSLNDWFGCLHSTLSIRTVCIVRLQNCYQMMIYHLYSRRILEIQLKSWLWMWYFVFAKQWTDNFI